MGWDTSNNMDSGPGHRPGSMTWANKTIGVGPTKKVKQTRKSQKCPNLTAQNPPVSYIYIMSWPSAIVLAKPRIKELTDFLWN